jgi:hypothetical protein
MLNLVHETMKLHKKKIKKIWSQILNQLNIEWWNWKKKYSIKKDKKTYVNLANPQNS